MLLTTALALVRVVPESGAGLAATMYSAGALVFGGGHVVLPLLESALVPDTIGEEEFLAGYGLAQAVPGPLFTFAAYIGQIAAGLPGAVAATVMIFLPGSLLMLGVLPFWRAVAGDARLRAALVGVNAAVVGILAAALWDPIITSAITGPAPAVLAAALFALLRFSLVPLWTVPLIGAAAGAVLL